jgi:hypothetical protein
MTENWLQKPTKICDSRVMLEKAKQLLQIGIGRQIKDNKYSNMENGYSH